MEIRDATIYGFGKWVDYSIDFSNESFTCVVGENESGKSTIQQFILFILFGLSPKKRSFYQPKTSGKMGGRVTIYDDDIGEFVIERLHEVKNGAAQCYTPDGQTFGEEWLHERMNGMTQTTYQSIFSFSAADLIHIKGMKEEDLGEVLLGIGLTGSKNIHSIEKNLDTKIGDLFKPYGKKPAINRQLDSLEELHTSLSNYQQSEKTYREKKSTINKLSDELDNHQAALQRAKKDLSRTEKTQQALPIVKTYKQVLSQLSHYPESIPFPENGVERLQRVNEKLLPLKSELAVLRDNYSNYEQKMNVIRSSFYDNSVYKHAQSIMNEKQPFMDGRRDLETHSEAITKLEVQINTELDQLNAGLSKEELESISLPFHIEKTWNKLKNDRNHLAFAKDQLEQENRQLATNLDYLKKQQEELNVLLLSEDRTSELLEKIKEHNQSTYTEKLKQDSIVQQNTWRKRKENKKKSANYWLAGTIMFAIILGLFAGLKGQTTLLAVAGIIAVAGVFQWVAGKRSYIEMERMLQDNTVDRTSISISEEERKEAEELLATNDQRKHELSTLIEQMRSVNIELLQWEEKKRGLEQKENRLQEQVSDQCESYPVLNQIEIEFWPEFFHTLRHLLNLNRELQQYVTQYKSLKKEETRVNESLNRFFDELKWELKGKAISYKFTEISNMLDEHKGNLDLLDQYRKWISENSEYQRNMKQKMHVYQQETANLLRIAQVNNEEAFLKEAKQLEEKRELETKRMQLADQVGALLSVETHQAFIEGDIPYQDEMDNAYKQQATRMKELEEAIDQKRQQRADVNAELANMESSEVHSELLHRFSIEQEQLAELAEQWSVYKTAKEMLLETKRNYRDKYLGKVLEKTTYFFSKLTANHYLTVYAPFDGKPFQVETHNGVRYATEELSQGTIDQLYVSLRLAISEVMSDKHRVPFIIDDAFVHFDSVRTQRIVEILADISTKQQIILFTCKKDVLVTLNHANLIKLKNSVRIN